MIDVSRNLGAALADPDVDLYWTDRPAAVAKLLAAVREASAERELLDLMREQLQGLVHNVLAIFDGDVSLDEGYRVAIAGEDSKILGDDDLHEAFIEFLFNTGRAG